MRTSMLAWALPLVLGCRVVVPYRVESDFDADADIDVDETDGRPYDAPDVDESPYAGMTGTVHYEAALNGGPGCEARIDLTGRTYEGNCPSCIFTFDIDAEIVSTNGPREDCPLLPEWTFVEDGVTIDPKLGYSPTYVGITEVLWFGSGFDLTDEGYGVYPGPFWSALHYNGLSGELSIEGGEQLRWTNALSFDYPYGVSPYLDPGCVAIASNPEPPLPGSNEALGDVSCDYLHMDVFEVEATAGSLLVVGVDTISADSAFHPVVLVERTDGCIIGSNFSAFRCTEPPPGGQWCAGLELEVPETDTYWISVLPYEDIECAAPVGEYRLLVSGADSEPVLLADDVYQFGELRHLDVRVELNADLEWR